MHKFFNKRFRLLLKEYELHESLSFHVDIPPAVQEILDNHISITELGITLGSNKLYEARKKWESRSLIEDGENHFHVDWYIESRASKQAFMLGIKTLVLLANKFQEQKLSGLRFWYYFETPELTKQWAQANKLHRDDDEYYIRAASRIPDDFKKLHPNV
jgi:hypothetical protein